MRRHIVVLCATLWCLFVVVSAPVYSAQLVSPAATVPVKSLSTNVSPTHTVTPAYLIYSPLISRAADRSSFQPPTMTPTVTPTSTAAPSTQTSTITSTPTTTPTATDTSTPTITSTLPQTPTSTASPTPSLTSTVTPTSEPRSVYVLPNQYTYVTNSGYLHVIGQVKNNSTQNRKFIRITADFFDAQGHLVDTGSTYVLLSILSSGSTTCFDLSVQNHDSIAYFRFETPSSSETSQNPPSLTVLNDSGAYDPTLGVYRTIGFVRNDAPVQIRSISTITTLYSSLGQIRGCDFTYINSGDLDPGQQSSFKTFDFESAARDISSYSIQASGDAQSASVTPTVTPPPLATGEPAGLHILPTPFTYVDSINYYNIVGEVKNNTSSNFSSTKVIADFFDAQGHLVDTDIAYTPLDVLSAGVKTCFRIALRNNPSVVSFQFERPVASKTTNSLPPLTVIDDSGSYDDILHSYKLVGFVRNDAPDQVRFVQVIATLYRASGQAVDCANSYVNSTDLDPGQESSFTIHGYGPASSEVTTYSVQTDGQLQTVAHNRD